MAFKADVEHEVARFEYNGGEIRIKAVKAYGKDSIDVRRWYPSKENEGELKPGKGLYFNVEVAEKIKAAIDEACEWLVENS